MMTGQAASRRKSSTGSTKRRHSTTHRIGTVTVDKHGRGLARCQTLDVAARFLTLADVADALNVSSSQVYALVRTGELRAMKIGGRGQWRVNQSDLEAFITQRYEQTEQFIAEHPFSRVDADDDSS